MDSLQNLNAIVCSSYGDTNFVDIDFYWKAIDHMKICSIK